MNVIGGEITRQTTLLNSTYENFFPFKMPLRVKRLSENIKSGSLFGYLQCDNNVPESFREAFVNFPPNFKNSKVDRNEIGPFVKEYVEKERLLSQPRRMLISS